MGEGRARGGGGRAVAGGGARPRQRNGGTERQTGRHGESDAGKESAPTKPPPRGRLDRVRGNPLGTGAVMTQR